VTDRVARSVRVAGHVQGVFFRAWTRDEARSLRVTGWVRNCSDGSVEAHVEGDEAAVGELIRRMRHGPPHARVADVQVSETPVENLSRFEVQH
jgi:acylphosphatase